MPIYDMVLLLKLFNYFSSKLIRFGGYKNWVLTSDDGYKYKIIPYEVKVMDRDCGPPGPRVVNSLFEVVENPACHEIFFDNVFTSVGLLKSLPAQGIQATGTIRANRLNNIPLPSLLLNLWRRKPGVLWKFPLQMIFVLVVGLIMKWW